MLPGANLERETDNDSYSYIFVDSPDNSLFHCERILRNHDCHFSGFIPFNEKNSIGKYLFDNPLGEDVLRDLKNAGCEIYSKI